MAALGWTVPDKGEPTNDTQAVLFQEYLDVLTAGINGQDCVTSGCAVTGNANMAPTVAKGSVLSNGTLFAVASATVTIGTADATLPRIDLIVIDNAGAKQVRAGTPGASPKPAVRSTNDVVLAAVYVAAGDTSIATTDMTDMRMIRDRGICLKRDTTAQTQNSSAAAVTYGTITLPSGLFLAGKILRVRIGGNYLANSGVPTFTLGIIYGGTTMFGDVSLAATAGTVRGAWFIDFDLTAQANNDQALVGFITYANTPTGSRIAGSVAGFGDILGSNAVAVRPVTTPFTGSAAIDSDAGDRTLQVQWTMSVSNPADEIVREYATYELV